MTWAYIPNLSGTSASVPEEEDSTSASSWRCQALAQHFVSRGKHSPSPIWSRRCAKVSWLKHLAGQMPEPSMADRGVALWMASLAASRASRIPLQEERAEATTSATSGHPPGASSSSQDLGSSSSRTSPACSRRAMTKSLEPNGFGETYASWVTRLRQDSSRRRKSALRTSVSASSSSAWPTATTSMTTGAGGLREGGENIQTAVAQWPTPQARDGKGANQEELQDRGVKGPPLNEVAVLWRTPTFGSENQARGLGQAEEMARRRVDAGHALNLQDQVALWQTPATDSFRSRGGDRKGEQGLDQQARGFWPTPTHGDSKASGSRNTENSNAHFGVSLTDMALGTQGTGLSSLPAPEMPRLGEPSSSTDQTLPRRSLNPIFVGWLMGWPPIALTGFGFSETASCHWLLAMRSALLCIALPQEAPPVQLALFG